MLLGKLLSTLPLTCATLGEDRLASEVSQFWRARLPRSFYFLEEALAFCHYLAERMQADLSVLYLDEVVAYERRLNSDSRVLPGNLLLHNW